LIRVSTQGQAARDTPQDQRAALDHLRRSRPGVLVERIEGAVSGAADGAERPDLARLAELAALRAFDEVRVRHLDRLTRHEDPLERAAVLSMVRRAGALIVDAGGAVLDPRSMGGELTWVVTTIASAEERRKIVERTTAAKRRLAGEGRLVCGRPPWGRTWDKKRGWGTDPAVLATYRRLFDLCIRGASLSEIADTLNAEGVGSPRGRPWDPSNVSRLIHDPAARGEYVVGGERIRVPAVVDEETYRAAADRLASAMSYSGPKPSVFAMLRRIAACGECGALMRIRHGKGGRHYYVCPSVCSGYHYLPEVDAVVREALRSFLERPGALHAAAEEPHEDASQAAQEAATEAERTLRALDTREENLARLVTKGLVRAKVGEKQLAEIAQLRAQAERDLAQAKAEMAAAERRAELAADLEARIAGIREGLATATPEEWRDLCLLLFPRGGVRIQRDGRIDLRGALPLDDRGEAALRRAADPAAPIRLTLKRGRRSL
jgi:DNA invertase Pin-like site-specific DNA recombinase